HPFAGPLDGFLSDLPLVGGVFGVDHAYFVGIQVLFTVRQDRIFATHDDAGVEAALGDHEVPHRLAGLRFQSQRGAVGSAGDQQPHAIDLDDVHRGVAGVVGTPAWRPDAHDVARAFVLRD